MLRRIAVYTGSFLLIASSVFSATYTVSKSGDADFFSVQDAVNKAGENDMVIIEDVSVYNEQVVIDSTKNGLILRGKDILARHKPTIRFKDTMNVHPVNFKESKDKDKHNYDRNGALIVMHARRVTIEGIAVDGGGVMPFGYEKVWGDENTAIWPLQHGNGGITLWISSDAVIRYCDISNAYFGVNVKDRNIGGAYAIINESDVDSLENKPFSKFGQTGNHVIEKNRIHDNSFGLYFESTWDLGSTIRYNLFYENHHPNDSVAKYVKTLTLEGVNQPGGAIMTKDHLVSPLAIHNNTFWHNSLIFAGSWKAGGQHLVFNNIYGAPYVYYSKDEIFGGSGHLDMMKSMAKRMHNCVIASQQQAPTSKYISITNDFSQPKAEGDITTKPFPASAEIRYLETGSRFKSTDSASDDFLVPDWSDAMVQKYIIDQGWDSSGIKDPDGSRSDIGAIAKCGERISDVITLSPLQAIYYEGGSAVVTFSVNRRIGSITDCKVTMAGTVCNLDTSECFGSAYHSILQEDLHSTAVEIEAVSTESENKIVIPEEMLTGDFAFFEMFVTGTGSDGKQVTTAAGFMPYRKTAEGIRVGVRKRVLVPESAIKIAAMPKSRCELMDLKGRVIERWVANGTAAIHEKSRFSGVAGKGFYLLRLTSCTDGALFEQKKVMVLR